MTVLLMVEFLHRNFAVIQESRAITKVQTWLRGGLGRWSQKIGDLLDALCKIQFRFFTQVVSVGFGSLRFGVNI